MRTDAELSLLVSKFLTENQFDQFRRLATIYQRHSQTYDIQPVE